jgi:hypothetical protein
LVSCSLSFPGGLHPTSNVDRFRHNPSGPLRRGICLLLAVLFLVTACQQAVHSHRSLIPDSKQISDSLDSNAAARCHLCLHSQAAPLGGLTLSVSPYLAVEAAVLPASFPVHAPGEDSVHRVRPPPAA